MSDRFSGVTVNTLLSGLPPLSNQKLSFFGIDMVGDPTSSTLFVSIYRIHCVSFKHNCSGCMVAFTISLSRKEAFRFFCNLKKYIPSFLPSKASYKLNCAYLPPIETNDIGYRLFMYMLLY